MIFIGSKVYERCAACGQMVQINKFIFGSLHACLNEKELEYKKTHGIPEFPPITNDDARSK